MNAPKPVSPRTPLRKPPPWKNGSSPSSSGRPGCFSSTPSRSCISEAKSPGSARKLLWNNNSPSKLTNFHGSPVSKTSFNLQDSKTSPSSFKENGLDKSSTFARRASSTDASWNVKTFSSTESNGALTVELEFPDGGWAGDDSSDGDTSCSLEIVESEIENKQSPLRGRKRKQSEVSEEDSAILSGMGEEIERQLEAKAERNRLTVPNVKNILRSVITNPHVQAMVRRSIKSGDVSISGDTDEMSFEPRLTRAKAKLLCDDSNIPDISWVGTPHKAQPTSECQALINEELNDDSDDDEEYHPGEDEPSDNDYSERDGSERGSERDISLEQSPAFFETDTESCPATPSPSPKPHIIDSSTQTNWSEDGVFKVPLVPSDLPLDHRDDENIALRTRSKLPLNDTPLEEIEQAFIPPDITPDLYDTTCDNADWQRFLQDFMQPMGSEVHNHDDEEEDPEYNILADEEIIDEEEMRKDRGVKVSKRELNELMKELMEFTENLSSEDEDKKAENDEASDTVPPVLLNTNEDVSLFLDTCLSALPPLTVKKATTPARSPSTPTLHTPVPPMSPPCSKTPGTGKKGFQNSASTGSEEYWSAQSCKGKPASGKKQTSGKPQSFPKTAAGGLSEKKQSMPVSAGKSSKNHPSSSHSQSGKNQRTPGKLDNYPNPNASDQGGISQVVVQTAGKLESYNISVASSDYCEDYPCNEAGSPIGMIGANVAVPVMVNTNGPQSFSPGKQYLSLNSGNHWDQYHGNGQNYYNLSAMESQSSHAWGNDVEEQDERCDMSSDQAGKAGQLQGKFPSAPGIQADETTGVPANFSSEAEVPVTLQAEESVKERRNVATDLAVSDGFQEQDGDLNDISSDPEVSISLPLSSSPPSPSVTDTELVEIDSSAYLSDTGDVVIRNEVVLSAPQRLVLDQQMRKHVQFLSQCFLQTYQHPLFGHHAAPCKKHLLSLHSLAKDKEKSAFRPANLLPALELVSSWEEKLSSREGSEVIRFMKEQVDLAARNKRYRQKQNVKFSPQLFSFMAESTVFIYPQLLPHIPFRLYQAKRSPLASEFQLLAIGLEEFTDFITENNPGQKKVTKWALEYVADLLVVGYNADNLYKFFKCATYKKFEALKYYQEHKKAPPTSHIVYPFTEKSMLPLKTKPHYSLPTLWRNYIYPSAEEAPL